MTLSTLYLAFKLIFIEKASLHVYIRSLYTVSNLVFFRQIALLVLLLRTSKRTVIIRSVLVIISIICLHLNNCYNQRFYVKSIKTESKPVQFNLQSLSCCSDRNTTLESDTFYNKSITKFLSIIRKNKFAN